MRYVIKLDSIHSYRYYR